MAHWGTVKCRLGVGLIQFMPEAIVRNGDNPSARDLCMICAKHLFRK